MLRNIKINVKVAGLIIALSLVAVVAISTFTYRLNVQNAEEKINHTISVLADHRAAQINQYFDNLKGTLTFIQQTNTIVNLEPDTASTESPEEILLQNIKQAYSYDRVLFTNQKGTIAFSSDGKQGEIPDPDGSFFGRASSGIAFSRAQRDSTGNYMYAGAPFNDKVLVVKVNLKSLFAYLSKDRVGSTAEAILAQPDLGTKKVVLISPLLFPAKTLLESSSPGTREAFLSMDGKDGNGVTTDYRGEKVMASWRKISAPGWVLITKIDEAEYLAQSKIIQSTYYWAGGTIILMAVALSMLFSRTLVKPLHDMRNTLDLVSKGVLPEKNENWTADEFGEMGTKVDTLVDMLKVNASFAQKVGEGKFDAEFKAASENDTLGLALINMRDNLVENARQNDERNWIVRGVAEASEILRLHDSLDALGDDIVQFIIKKINAVQGAFYIVNDENPDAKRIEIKASFAYGRKKYLNNSFRFAEGLVGQAAIEQDTVLRTEIPDEYVTITSGILGDQKPKCILITPLIANEEVYGVVEFAGLQKFNPSQVKFVQELSQIIARTVFNIKVNDRTRKLLAESQTMSAELKEKQSVLNQNAEEMQATQEELKRSNMQLEEQIAEVGRTQKRMQLLLENASEVITIYEENGTVRYISPSVESILGYSQREMQGRDDLDKVHVDGKAKFQEMFAHLKSQPEDKYTVQYEYKTKTGQYIWLESTGTNCMSNPAIHGYIVNSRDITERRRAEQEQRMRSKMQALSENSPDLITRLEEGVISYINPVIEHYTGHLPVAFLNKDAKETSLDTSILEQWLKVVEDVNASNDKISTEMTFPSVLGKRVMQVNAIPEYNESEKLESVLVVSHDITERKMIELEVQEKNKKINDSINYSKRIQNAILPNTRLVNKTLPNSFILYKPRDVVSGDFPWFVQIKNDIFIAAVDCTGHGVPGALLSLIGYFLLNDIVRSRRVSEPGIILDLLDEGVTQTLRQDQDDSATKDGMDIALCRINLETNEVQYAGAHRPLYYIKGGVMDEIKGNKFPIGGGIFKNQTNFTTHKLDLTAGDSIYFSSDGYPDQFGGPEVRKLGPKRVREMVEKAANMPMKEAYDLFDQEWEKWKGDHKQTDDVLLIGIKF
jgi:PAS domain S-box-containing protein